MKKITSRLSLFAIGGITILAAMSVGSCSKSSSPTTPVITPLGGYTSSDQVASANLIAYWPFDGDDNDHKGGLVATNSGTNTYTTGIRGQAYQGAAGNYATFVPPATFPTSLTSYTISFWYYLPAQPAAGTTEGVFFYSGTTQQGELVNEIEAPSNNNETGDSVRIHPGFWDIGDDPNYALFIPETFNTNAIGTWVFFTVSYNGGTSTYTTYQNAVPTGASTAFSPAPPANPANSPYPGSYITPNPLWTDATETTPLGNLGFTDAPSQITLGSWPNGLFGQISANDCFLGKLDELRVFDIALTQQEVSGLYLNGKAGR
jgi:hypothetical protein